ncbi:MAG: 2-succinyl-6-hydroxy-2,4-cyclohexadiene-1-carboxylate synthase [Geitlerinemataceae cyanobacterium]
MSDRFHYITDGNPRKSPLLWLHGFMGSCREFEPAIDLLKSEFYCIRIDLPGHGKTKWSGNYSMERTARAIVQFVDEQQLSAIDLVGYSMGGRIALHLALNFPEKFPVAILESASPGLKTVSERQSRSQQDADLADRLEMDFPQFLKMWYDRPLFASFAQQKNFDKILVQRWQNSPTELAKALRGLSTGEQPSGWQNLPLHRHPLLLLAGEFDRKFIAINQAMSELLPTAQLQIIPDAGHVVHVEQPIAFANRIAAFLSSIP